MSYLRGGDISSIISQSSSSSSSHPISSSANASPNPVSYFFPQIPIFLTKNTSYPIPFFMKRTFNNTKSDYSRLRPSSTMSNDGIDEDGDDEIVDGTNYSITSQENHYFKDNKFNYEDLNQNQFIMPINNESSPTSELLYLLEGTVQNSTLSNESSFLRHSSSPPFSLSDVAQSSYFGSNGSYSFIHNGNDLLDVTNVNWFILILAILVLIGVLGNLLVCLAICYERRLQNATNYFLLSLAIADLLVSIIVMPISILYEFYGFWPFGYTTCNFWVTFDVLCCSSSIYHMVFISVGRYFGIKNPLHARQTLMVSRRAVVYKIALAWLSSFVISCPITILALIDSSNIQVNSTSCYISNNYFLFVGSFAAFYIPMIVMLYCFVLTVRLLNQKAKFCRSSSSGKNGTKIESGENNTTIGCGGEEDKSTGTDFPSIQGTIKEKTSSTSPKSSSKVTTTIIEGRQLNTEPLMTRTFGSSLQVRTEQKASKVLGLVFFVFAVCWTPFFTLNLVMAIFPTIQVPSYLSTTFLWLGYSSSTMNPIIYTIFNRNFRRAFMKVLKCAYSCSTSDPVISSRGISTQV